MTIPQEVIDRLQELNIEDVALKLGLDVRKHKAICFKHDDHDPSLSFSVSKNLYKCWVCGVGGGPIKLVQDKNGMNFQEACVWLAGQFNIWWPGYGTDKKIAKRTMKKVSLRKNEELLRPFDEEVYAWLINNAKLSDLANKFLFEERLFKEDVIYGLNIKSVSYSEKVIDALTSRFGESRCMESGLVRRCEFGRYFYFYTPCLLFPYYEQDDRLVGVQSRYLGDNPKAPRFQFMSSQKTRLFNLPVLNAMCRGERLYISEGITDCLALLSNGLKAVAIPSATILPLEDLVLLKGYDLHMYPDQDEAGQRALTELRRFFVNHYTTLKMEKLPEGVKDYCDYYTSTNRSNGKE